jgi:parallel beta-helix repeat protein
MISCNILRGNYNGIHLSYSETYLNNPSLTRNQYSDNSNTNIFVTGTIGSSVTWNDGEAYKLKDVIIGENAILNISPDQTISVNGTLIVNGTIKATDAKFTWADGQTEWGGIHFRPGSNDSRLENCVIEHVKGIVTSVCHGACHYWYRAIWLNSSDAVITGCTIGDSSADYGIQISGTISPSVTNNIISGFSHSGIYVDSSASPLIKKCQFYLNNYGVFNIGQGVYDSNLFSGNKLYGLFNSSSGKISAINCNWGDPSGPYDPSDDRSTGGLYNPDGLGDKVSDKVLYMPWATLEKFIVSALAGENGEISPSGEVNVLAGQDASFSITAAEGYIISDVLVDGVAVGAVSNYTFSNISADHSIEASFINKISPTTPFPEKESSSLPLDTVLAWNVADPHSVETTTYDVYFGTAPDQLILVSEGQFGTSFNSGLLNGGTTYYWKIVAIDVYGVRIEGPVWSFATESILAGDIDYSGNVDFKDAILAFRIAIGLAVEQAVYPAADIDGDGAIGLAEAVYVLQRVAGVR